MKPIRVKREEITFIRGGLDDTAMYKGQKFEGIMVDGDQGSEFREIEYREGHANGKVGFYNKDGSICKIGTLRLGAENGYFLSYGGLIVLDMGEHIEIISVDRTGKRSVYANIEKDNWGTYNTYESWLDMRETDDQKPYYEGDWDIIPYYDLQNELRTKVIQIDQLPSSVRHVAGADVAYNELERRVVAGIVVMDAQTLKVVDQALHEDDVNFPYIPGLFSFREVPPLVEAYKKLTIKPDLIVCDGHGTAHPKGVGMACHLGIELNVPTIGCAKSRLVGFFEPVDLQRGSFSPLIWDSQAVGIALRTQDAINPVFVSVGHKVSLETAREWVLRLTPQYRLPETTRAVDQLVNRVMKERTELNLYFPDEK